MVQVHFSLTVKEILLMVQEFYQEIILIGIILLAEFLINLETVISFSSKLIGKLESHR